MVKSTDKLHTQLEFTVKTNDDSTYIQNCTPGKQDGFVKRMSVFQFFNFPFECVLFFSL